MRAIQNKRTHVIGVLVNSLRISFFSELVAVIEKTVEERGYQVLIGQTYSRHERVEKQISLFRQQRVDGVLVTPNPVPAYYARLRAAGLPLVFVSQAVQGVDIPAVISDDVLGAKLAVKHLIEMGHRRIAAFAWAARFRESVPDRYLDGYLEALREAAIPVDRALIEEDSAAEPKQVRTALRKIMKRTAFTALFAQNDLVAMAAIEELKTAGKRVPQDVAVVGYANLAEGAHFTPRLTSVDQKVEEMGRMAAMTLIGQIEHPEQACPIVRSIEPALIIRESCGFRMKQGFDRKIARKREFRG
ncbi:MAG: substrate-binding domain-containing protein [Kiritimatiellae bacterium]|nr:substrate-binding domain-containing protein [Kiritimatiellia bacterium]